MQESITLIHRSAFNDYQPDYVINLTLVYVQEDGQWVGFCQELQTSTFASTLPETRKDLTDAVLLQLNEVERLGFISEFLSDNHVTPVNLDSGAKEERGFAVANSAN